LPAVALFFAVSGPPFPGPALTVLASIAVGVGQILLAGVCASLGYGGFLPPSLAGWTPSLALAILAGLLSRRSV
jgi:lipopolysaccharide export LptBFGC system permease protein LptF